MDRPGSPDRDPRMFVVRPVTAVLLGYRNYRLGSYRTVIDPGAALERDDFFFESSYRAIFLFEHDLFGKPVPTRRVVARGHAFPDHALAAHSAARRYAAGGSLRTARLQRAEIADELPCAVFPGTLKRKTPAQFTGNAECADA